MKKLPFFLTGLLLPLIPRLSFEIKNNFLQTRNFFRYLVEKTSLTQINPGDVLSRRFELFFQYLREIFIFEFLSLMIVILSGLTLLLFFKELSRKKWIFFLLFCLTLVFLLSLIYSRGQFYSYYLNGIQYLIFSFLVLPLMTMRRKLIKIILTGIFIFYLVIIVIYFKTSITNKKIPLVGLRADKEIINYLIKKTNNQEFCLRIYTPPVIPYTYQYLIVFYQKKNLVKQPNLDFYQSRCYFIIDYDEYKFRVENWRKNNTPVNARLIEEKLFENKTRLEIYEIM
ncbi:MAG: hypothetical protein NZL96_01355 [Patescibacteria group bacterium]|nr:hypothetical protein [Patescibacteria group bacterium]